MSAAPPITFQRIDDTLVPLRRFMRAFDEHFVVGEFVTMVEHHERSANSHSHYFASLTDAWRNLPEDRASQFPSVEHLRKWAMIRAGFANHQPIVCASREEALRTVSVVRSLDPFSLVTVNDNVASVFTAQSQSMKAMGKTQFQDSKSKVLDIAWGLSGVNPAEHQKHGAQAA